MKINQLFKTRYVAPSSQIVPLTMSYTFMKTFSYGDPNDTGITIDTQGDDSDDDNFVNQQTGLWEEE